MRYLEQPTTDAGHSFGWGWKLAAVQEALPPFKPLSGGRRFEGATPGSPDPLRSWCWPSEALEDGYEHYVLEPVRMTMARHQPERWPSIPPDEIEIDHSMTISEPCTIEYDFGVEAPGWLEVLDLPPGIGYRLGVSEHRSPSRVNVEAASPEKTATPVIHGGVARLELNAELYEGVRFGYLIVDHIENPIPIPQVRLVVQTRRINYRGDFSGLPMLEAAWNSAAATIRHNLHDAGIGSILLERSDRYAWAGDTYPTIASSLYAFGADDLSVRSLERLRGISHGIATYELYWALAVAEVVRIWGPSERVLPLLADAAELVKTWWSGFDRERPLTFIGWDERLGAGLEDPDQAEGQALARALLVQATQRLQEAHLTAGIDSRDIDELSAASLPRLRAYGDWKKRGLHARAEAILAGLTELDLENVCSEPQLSLTPFSQWPIVRALSIQGRTKEALCIVDAVWGGQLRFGASTTMEAFRPGWTSLTSQIGPVPAIPGGTVSYAHPWGAGILSWIIEEYAGVKVRSRARETVHVEIRAEGSTDQHPYSLAVPTRLGDCQVNFESGRPIEVTVPAGVTYSLVPGPAQRDVAHEHTDFPADFRRLGTPSSPLGFGSHHYFTAGGGSLPPGWTVTTNRAEPRLVGMDGRVPVGAGVVSMRSRHWSDFTMSIDVAIPEGSTPATLTLYFVDVERVHQSFALDLFALDGSTQLARTHGVSNTEDGAYISFVVDQSVRVRVADLAFRGADLCALYVDGRDHAMTVTGAR